METYKVIHQFVDSSDNDHQYNPGDRYPRMGDADEERIKYLLAYDIPLIQPRITDDGESLDAQEIVEILESEEM